MLSTKSLYPSLHWQKETTATKTTWARCELQVSLAQGLGSSWAWFCAQLQGVKQSHAVLEAAQSCNYPKGSVPATRRGLKLNHGLVPWQGKWCLLEQDVIGRHWRAWQQRGQALPWAELLFQVSHHREESDLKCRDMAESIVCAAPVNALIAPNLTAPQKWDREHSKTVRKIPAPESNGSLSPLASHKLQVTLWMSCISGYFWLLQKLHNLSCIKEPRDRKHLFCSPLHPFHKDCSKFSFCSNPIQFHSPLIRTNSLIIWLTSKNWRELRPSNPSVSSTGWNDFWLLPSHVNGSCLKVTIYGC